MKVFAIAITVFIGALSMPHAAAQAGSTPATSRFEVATIKRCPPEEQVGGRARGTAGGTNATASPGRFYVPCVTLEQLIYLAYASYGARDDEHLANDYLGTASDDKKIRGGPDWVHSYKEKYAIEATAPGVTDRKILLSFLARQLAGPLGRHVIDETGVNDSFTVTLTYATDSASRADDAVEPANAPSIFTALEEQLGVKLVKITGKSGFIVIDHIERPRPDVPAAVPAEALAKAGVR